MAPGNQVSGYNLVAYPTRWTETSTYLIWGADLQNQIARNVHVAPDGPHLSQKKLFNAIVRAHYFYWRGMHRDIRDACIDQCEQIFQLVASRIAHEEKTPTNLYKFYKCAKETYVHSPHIAK
jgi:hypothetical protein